MLISDKWNDYELLDCGEGEKLERWGDIILQRPDPQAIWPKGQWDQPDAKYIRSSSGGGHWKTYSRHGPGGGVLYPPVWTVAYPGIAGELRFLIEPTGFKHTGLFPEQAVNWDFMSDKITGAIEKDRQPRILNLFAYTGAATVACAKAGAAEVVHVDASKGMNLRAKENLAKTGVNNQLVRFFTDDVNKFVEREFRRGRKYDGIIMDPPSYGRGPSGELWKLEDALYDIVRKSCELLSDNPLFFIINSYTTGLSPIVLSDIMQLTIIPEFGGTATADELGLQATGRNIILPCGATGRWRQACENSAIVT